MAPPLTQMPSAHDGAATAATIAIVVGTFNRLDQLKALVESVRTRVRTAWELHVSDAGSTDGTREWLAAEAGHDARINPVFEEERSGQAAALNAVFSRLSTPFACWLSDDNVLVGDGLDIAVTALEADGRLGMVGLKVKDRRGPFADAAYIGGITSTGVINVNQGVLPTPLLQTLGGFGTEFRDYGIDAVLTTRVLLAGYDVAMTRGVAIHHYRNWPDTGSSEAVRHEQRNADYRARYDKLYRRRLPRNPMWIARRAAWKALRLLAGGRLSPERGGVVLGRPVRDWHNMLAAQFVRLPEELGAHDTPLYLRQHAPGGKP